MEESIKTKPAIRSGVSFLISEWREYSIKHGTKGTFVYEVLQMHLDNEFDHIDEYESMVDSQLHAENVYLSEEIPHTVDVEEVIRQYDSDSETVRMKIWLPASFKDELPQRGLGHLIEEALEDYLRSSFKDRLHRIRVKKVILEAVQNDEAPEHPIAEKWMDVNGYLEEEWYQDDEIDVETLRERGQEIVQTNRDTRIETLRTAVMNAEESPTEMNLVELCEDSFEVTEETAQSYIDDADLVVRVENPNIFDMAKQYKKDLVAELPESSGPNKPKSSVQNRSVSEVMDISPKLADIGANPTAKEVFDVLTESLEGNFRPEDDNKLRKSTKNEVDGIRFTVKGKTNAAIYDIVSKVEEVGFDPADYLELTEEEIEEYIYG